jgi:hypothetical protein
MVKHFRAIKNIIIVTYAFILIVIIVTTPQQFSHPGLGNPDNGALVVPL